MLNGESLNGESRQAITHHPSHAGLVRPDWPAGRPDRAVDAVDAVNAVVVPASRRSSNLGAAVRLARSLRCPLVVACSAEATVGDVAGELDSWQGVAFGLTGEPPTAVRRLRTRQLALRARPPARSERQAHAAVLTRPRLSSGSSISAAPAVTRVSPAPYLDAATKRNVGLLLARQLGWRRLLFLDDDIQPPPAEAIRRATSMLGPAGASMASWPAREFPDNSVACHARRAAGLEQDTFLAGGCLLVDLTRPLPFFPAVYNEDWLFCWEAVRDRRMALPGTVDQVPYNPFDPQRAAREEFGDILGEGLFALLHHGRSTDRAAVIEPARHPHYWERVLAGRRTMLAEVVRRLQTDGGLQVDGELQVDGGPGTAGRLAAVRAGQERAARITPDELAGYVAIWLEDLETWRYELAQLHREDTFKAALNQLGIDEFQRVGVM